MRVFVDRLNENSEKYWAKDTLQQAIISNIPHTDSELRRSNMCYTRFLTNSYMPSDIKISLGFEEKLKLYSEENDSAGLVFFDECIELITNIERRLSIPGGHTLLVELSGTGKTLLSSFVAWYLEMPVIRLGVHKEYTLQDFDSDLRKILCAALEGKVCFIIKDTDIILPVFTERLNVLLTESTIPGIFAGDGLQSLLQTAKYQAKIAGQVLESEESIIKLFR